MAYVFFWILNSSDIYITTSSTDIIHCVSDLYIRWVAGGDAKIKAHDFPSSALIQDDVFWTQVTMHHLHPIVQEGQALRYLGRGDTGPQGVTVNHIWQGIVQANQTKEKESIQIAICVHWMFVGNDKAF